MNVDHGVELLVAHFLNHVVPGVACVVDESVHVTAGVERSVDEARTEIGGRHRTDARARNTARPLNERERLHGRDFIEIVDDDPRSFRGELQRDGTTDTATRTSHEGHFSRQLGHWFDSCDMSQLQSRSVTRVTVAAVRARQR